MRKTFVICSLLLNGLCSYGQEKLASRGKDQNDDEVEYYLQTATVKNVDGHMEATVRKYVPGIDRTMWLECKVDCEKNMFMIPQTRVKNDVYTRRDAHWSMIISGSLIEKVFTVICTY